MSNTPNMNLPVPSVGVTSGPDYASDINASLTIIDQHDHSNDSGVQITPSGININAALTYNNNFAIGLAGLTLTAQNSTPGNNTVYESGVDLYYVDGNGNNIQLTKAGSPNAGTGNIQGLPSTPNGGAGISWVNSSSTFQFFADDGTSQANIDVASIAVRYPGSYPTPTGNYIQLQAPSSLSSGYGLTLPAIPVSQKIMTLDNSGIISAPYVVDNTTIEIATNIIQVKDGGISTAKLANLSVTDAKIANQTIDGNKLVDHTLTTLQISNAAGITPRQLGSLSFTASAAMNLTSAGTAGVWNSVTNGSATITTISGRPVFINFFASTGTFDDSYLATGANTAEVSYRIRRSSDSVIINSGAILQPGGTIRIPGSVMNCMDFSPAGGSDTYVFEYQTTGGVMIIKNVRMLCVVL